MRSISKKIIDERSFLFGIVVDVFVVQVVVCQIVIGQIVFAFFDFSAPVYIIIVGIICLIFLLVFNGIYRAKQ